jgi:sortase A
MTPRTVTGLAEPHAPLWRRSLFVACERVLWLVGLTLIGWCAAVWVGARVYQERQSRAFEEMRRAAPAASPSAGVEGRTLAPATAPSRPSADPLLIGRIEIPRLGVSAMVREGDDEGTLKVAVGHIPGTALPDQTGNVALAGHRDSFFRPLRNIRLYDTIRVTTASATHEYRVESTEIVWPEDVRVLEPTAGPVLTLVTCFPFDYTGHAPRRFIVRARGTAGEAPPR